MLRKSYIERQMQEAIELGKENAELYPRVANWCRHLQIQMRSAGLYAQWYRLPIGLMEITCEHASAGGIQAMQLRHVATSFIVNNCRGCPFHEAVDIDNIGHIILKEWEEIQEQRQARAEQVNVARVRLHELVSGDLTEALRHADITEESILQLVVLLEDESHHTEAAKKLVQASEIAAELFSDLAVEVICSHFPDPDHGQHCIACVRHLGQQDQIPQVAFDAARRCLEELHHADDACALIGDYVALHDFVPEKGLIAAIAGIQWHGHTPGISLPVHRDYPGSTHALIEIGKRDLVSLSNVLGERLGCSEGQTRISAAHIVLSLIDVFPVLTLEMVDSLINSLELPDDSDGYSADGAACSTLAAIYVCHPDEVQEKLEAGYQRVSMEAKPLLYTVYRYIALGKTHRVSTSSEERDPIYEKCIPRVIPCLLQAIGGRGYPVDVKETASDALEVITRRYPAMLADHLDTLLGTLANLSQEEVLLNDSQSEDTLAILEKQAHQAQYGGIVRRLVGALRATCSLEPRVMLSRLQEIVPNLDSTQPHLARYKSELVALYGQLGAYYDLTPEVIPDLYKFLLDFDSVAVRGAAIEALSEILQHRADVVPHNMIEILTVYLTDTYVYIHRSATRAMRYVHPSNVEEATAIAYRLLALDQACQDTPHFREDIRRALIHVTRDHTGLLATVTVSVLVVHARIPEPYIAEHALEAFEALLPRLPQKHTAVFAREVFSFLQRSQRELYNDETYSGRYQLLLALFELPREAILVNIDHLQETARAKAKDDFWDALRMVQLLSYFELYAEAASLAQEILADQPQTKRHETAIREGTMMGALAQVEDLIGRGETGTALQLLEEISTLEAQRYADEKTHDTRDVVDTFSVAERIASRLTRI